MLGDELGRCHPKRFDFGSDSGNLGKNVGKPWKTMGFPRKRSRIIYQILVFLSMFFGMLTLGLVRDLASAGGVDTNPEKAEARDGHEGVVPLNNMFFWMVLVDIS